MELKINIFWEIMFGEDETYIIAYEQYNYFISKIKIIKLKQILISYLLQIILFNFLQ